MAAIGAGGQRVLVAGIPRSGTTWVGRVLGQAVGACYVHEPDNHLVRPEAWWAKRPLGAYPRLVPGEAAPDYERLFRVAFAGGSRPSPLYPWARVLHRWTPGRELPSPGHREGGTRRAVRWLAAPRPHAGRYGDVRAGGEGDVRAGGEGDVRVGGEGDVRVRGEGDVVVKSIFCARSLDWLSERFGPAVVLVERHPFAVLGSWAELGWDRFLDSDPAAVAECRAAFGVDAPRTGASWVDRAAWHFGFLSALLGRARARHPDWQVVAHADLCARPEAAFEALCAHLGLTFGTGTRDFLLASNRPGKGYSTNRVWAEQLGGRQRLTPAQRERVSEILARFAPVPVAGPRPVPASPSPSALVPARR